MKQITLRKPLFVSIGIHALLFGTAIAFAGYRGGALRDRHDTTISVALAGSDSLSGSTRAATPIHQEHKRSAPLPVHDTGITPPEYNHANTSDRNAEQMPTMAAEGHEGDQKGAAAENAESMGQTPGAKFGLVPSREWAIISAALEKAKSYPRLARERGLQGVVRVRFKLKPSGDVDRVEIAKSSGSDVLDAASVKTVYRASPMPHVNGWLEVPMTYVLK